MNDADSANGTTGTPRTGIRVAICGAGVAGLMSAIALMKSYKDAVTSVNSGSSDLHPYPKLEIAIFESAEKLEPIGAGIGVWPRPWEVIRRLGLEQDLLKTTESKPTQGQTPAWRYRVSDQSDGFEFFRLFTQGSLIYLRRAEYQQVLLYHLDLLQFEQKSTSCQMYFSKRLRTCTQLGQKIVAGNDDNNDDRAIQLFFEDGSSHTCDVLLGADGVKSAVRRCMLEEQANTINGSTGTEMWLEMTQEELLRSVEPTWSGHVVYRALIPAEKLKDRVPEHSVLKEGVVYLGKDLVLIVYPISQGSDKAISFSAYDMKRTYLENTKYDGPWVTTVDKSVIETRFKGWEEEVKVLVECIETPLQEWAIHTVPPMKSFISGRVAVLGDAAHAMTPYQGSGAGQAIEDAFLLAFVLCHPRTFKTASFNLSRSIHRALRIYDSIRRPLANAVMEWSRTNGGLCHLSLSSKVDGIEFDSIGDINGADSKMTRDEMVENLQKRMRMAQEKWEWAWTTSIDGMMEEAARLMEQ